MIAVLRKGMCGRRARGAMHTLRMHVIRLIGLLGLATSVGVAAGATLMHGASDPVPSLNGGFVLCVHGKPAECVVDGDTFHSGGLTYRIADIDAPEVFSPKCASEKALGDRATDRLLALLDEGPVTLVAADRDEDKYGRKLRIVSRDGVSLGATLVAEGLARQWDGARHPWCS